MKLAILIGNSDYENLKKLDSCINDLNVMELIINASKKFDEILKFENYNSSELKEKLSKNVSSLKDSPVINELFFYYTGHGTYKNSQFYYLPIDYSENHHKSTSLSNEELDQWLKEIKPEIVTKVVDACNSGINYIKSIDDETSEENLFEYLDKSSLSFNKCYFMFSSLIDQNSYIKDKISEFTKAFVESISNHNSSTIRYKDIIDYISDYFDKDNKQTPFFVTQSDFTEKFIDELGNVQKSLNSYLANDSSNLNNSNMEGDGYNNEKLLELIKNDNKRYIDKEKALNYISKILNNFMDITCESNLSDIFELKTKIIKYAHNIDNLKNIASSLIDNKEEYYINADGHGNFSHSISTPGIGCSFELLPKYQSLNKYVLNVLFIFNNQSIIFYFNKIEYYRKNWDKWFIFNKKKWIKGEWNFNDYDIYEKDIDNFIAKWQNEIHDEISKTLEK